MNVEIKLRESLVFGWSLVLISSAVPEIALGLHYPLGPFEWLSLVKAAILGASIVVSLQRRALSPLRTLAIALFVLHVASGVFGGVVGSSAWNSWISDQGTPFIRFLVNNQLVRVGMAGSALVSLYAMFRSRSRFFLQVGDVRAKASRVAWLGISGESSWMRVGSILTVVLSSGTLAFLATGMPRAIHLLPGTVSLLPIVVGFAVINALGEEIIYRLALVATAREFASWGQAAMMSSVYFGLAHYYGIPSGMLGVLMAGFLGWLACRSIRDTKGVAWAFMMHVVQDIWIFWFMAVAFTTANTTR